MRTTWQGNHHRLIVGGALLVIFLLIGGLAVTIPFVYESQSLWYKFGVDKSLLRAGKVMGILTFLLICCQALLAARVRLVDLLLGLDRGYRLHRYLGLAIVFLVLGHLLLVLAPEGLRNLPVGWKYWPEMVGGFAMLLLLYQAGSGLLRRRLKLHYARWRRVHGLLGYCCVLLLTLHVLNVSESFGRPVPKTATVVLILATLGVAAGVKVLNNCWRNRTAQIAKVRQLNDTATELTLALAPGKPFRYQAGQFAFIKERGLLAEPHPFSLVSIPGECGRVQFIIKDCGDWTSQIRRWQLGRKLVVEGPYGHFYPEGDERERDLLLVAGGIGITPLLSLLRELAGTANNEGRQIFLIWCLRLRADMFLGEELEQLQRALPSLSVHCQYSGGQGGRRLDQAQLRLLTKSVSRKALVLICGPEQMMLAARSWCLALGFRRSRVRVERFAL